MRETVHASTVAIGGRGVMIMGPPGAGKSDLALRLIDRGAELVSDDYTQVESDGAVVTASPPETIAGRIEVRGLGIIERPYRVSAPVALVVRLGAPERMPEAASTLIAGREISEMLVDPAGCSAPIKVELAVEALAR